MMTFSVKNLLYNLITFGTNTTTDAERAIRTRYFNLGMLITIFITSSVIALDFSSVITLPLLVRYSVMTYTFLTIGSYAASGRGWYFFAVYGWLVQTLLLLCFFNIFYEGKHLSTSFLFLGISFCPFIYISHTKPSSFVIFSGIIFLFIYFFTKAILIYTPHTEEMSKKLDIITFFIFIVIFFYKSILLIALNNSIRNQLTQSQEKYKQFIRYTREGVFYVEFQEPISISLPIETQYEMFFREGVVVDSNDIFAQHIGFKNSSALQGQSMHLIYRHLNDRFRRKIFRAFTEGNYQVKDIEVRGLHPKTRKELYYTSSGYGVLQEGKLVGVWGTLRDVTEQRRATLQLKENEARISSIINSTDDIIYAVDNLLNIIAVNNAGAKLFKEFFAIDLQIGMSVLELNISKIHIFDSWKGYVARALSGETFSIVQYLPVGTSKRYFLTTFSPIYNENHKVTAVSAFAKDITHVRALEIAQRENEAKLRAILENSSDLFLIADLDMSRPLFASPSFETVFEKDLPDLSPEHWISKIHPLDRERVLQLHHSEPKRIQTNPNYKSSVQCRLLNAKGEYVWFESITSLITISDTQEKSLLIVLRNIHEAKMALEQLKEREEMYRMLFEHGFVGIEIQQQDNNNFLSVEHNEKIALLVPVTPNMPINWVAISPLEQPNKMPSDIFWQKLEKSFAENHRIRYEWQVKAKDGEHFVDLDVSKFKFEVSGKPTIITVVNDISQSKHQEAIIRQNIIEIRQANDQLKKYIESNMQLENFAYIASHDLREPMRTIISFSQLLERKAQSKLGEAERMYLNYIVTATLRMETLISDLLAYSRVDTKRILFETIDFQQLFDTVLMDLRYSVERTGAKVSARQLPLELQGDIVRLRQLIQNLLSNAIKFSKPDLPPVVEVQATEKENHWLFEFTDYGIGIESQYFDNIFLLFRRLHTRDKYEGTGIGLALCKKVVEQHGGRIWVASEKGVYTTFYFTLKKGLADAQKNALLTEKATIARQTAS